MNAKEKSTSRGPAKVSMAETMFSAAEWMEERGRRMHCDLVARCYISLVVTSGDTPLYIDREALPAVVDASKTMHYHLRERVRLHHQLG